MVLNNAVGVQFFAASGIYKVPLENDRQSESITAAPAKPLETAQREYEPMLDISGFGSWARDPTLIPGMSVSSSSGHATTVDPFAGAATATSVASSSDTLANSGCRFDSSAPAGSGAALVHSEQHSSVNAKQNGRELLDSQSGPAAGQFEVPDLSFMLSDKLVLPKRI